jgi:hypothetical protein
MCLFGTDAPTLFLDELDDSADSILRIHDHQITLGDRTFTHTNPDFPYFVHLKNI